MRSVGTSFTEEVAASIFTMEGAACSSVNLLKPKTYFMYHQL